MNEHMFGYENLHVWKEASGLTFLVHQLTKKFPSDEKFTYTSQIRRSALSIPSNIAEGKGRMSDRELQRFCSIANGSAMELQTQLRLAKRLTFAPINDFLPVEEKRELVLRLLKPFHAPTPYRKAKCQTLITNHVPRKL